MGRLLGFAPIAVLTVLTLSGCVSAGGPEPRFAHQAHEHQAYAHQAHGSGVGAFADFAGSLADLIGAIHDAQASGDDESQPAECGDDESSGADPDAPRPTLWDPLTHLPPVVTSPPTQRVPFDTTAARSALESADVSSCTSHGAPAGYVHTRATFGSDGHVTAVTVDASAGAAPLMDDATACIAEKLRSVTAPPFDGAPITVGASVLVR
jgi:hypothetical protein